MCKRVRVLCLLLATRWQADVHSFYADGAISLHARSLKYGKVLCGASVGLGHGA